MTPVIFDTGPLEEGVGIRLFRQQIRV